MLGSGGGLVLIVVTFEGAIAGADRLLQRRGLVAWLMGAQAGRDIRLRWNGQQSAEKRAADGATTGYPHDSRKSCRRFVG